MYPVSADFHNLSIADAPTSRVRIYFIEANVDCTDDNDVQSNGTLLCMPGETDSNGRIEKDGVTINEFFNSDANVQIGATVSSQIGMTLINRDGALDGFNYGRCKVYIDVYDDTNSTWLTCPMGVYNIAIPKRRKVQLVSATGYDQMQQLDEIADSWWNGLDWSNGITLLQIIQSMAATLGIHLSANTSANIVNSGLSYTEIPFTAIEMTYRDILSYIAETTGTIARFDRNGALDLRWFSDAVLSTDTQTYAGGLITFTASTNAYLSDLVATVEPKQDLHGQSNPYLAGGGINMFDMDSAVPGYIIGTGTGISNPDAQNMTSDFIPVTAGETYTYTAWPSEVGVGYWTGWCFYGSQSMSDNIGTRSVNTSGTTVTITVPTGAAYIRIGSRYLASGKAQFEKGSVGHDWSPYENICPISGMAGLSLYRTGKNLLDKSKAKLYNNVARFIKFGVSAYSDTTPNGDLYLEAGTYTFSVSGDGTANFTAFRVYNSIGTSIKVQYNAKISTFTVSEKGAYIITLDMGDAVDWSIYNIQLELGSTATAYESFGTTYNINWSDTAGTIYKGYYTKSTGKLTATWVGYTVTEIGGSTGWSLAAHGQQSGGYGYWCTIRKTDALNGYGATPTNGDTKGLCSYGRWRQGAQDQINEWRAYTRLSGSIYVPDIVITRQPEDMTEAKVNTLLASLTEPLTVCYELETPIEFDIGSTQIGLLPGTNNIWADADTISVAVAEPNLVEIQTDTVGNQCLSIDVGEYQVSQIDALSVKASQTDVGVTIGSGGNAYTILDNPMLFGDEAAIMTKATPIYNRLSAFRLFTPISMRCIMDWSIEAGDIITVTNESVTYDLPIFQQRLRWRGGYVVSDLFSNGEQERPTQSKEIRSSFRSNTQMHEFEVTLEQLRSYIQSVDGNYTLIQQTVDAITQIVANQNVTIQNILDPTGEIWTAITKNTSNLSSIEDSLNNEITERRSYIRFIPSEPAIVMGVDEDNEIKLKLVNNIIYFFNGADDSTDLSLAYAYFNSQEAFADRFVAGESVQIGANDNAAHWLWKKLNNGDLVLELVG